MTDFAPPDTTPAFRLHDGGPAPGDRPASETGATHADRADTTPQEFTAIFGDPDAIRPLGEVGLEHRRRGMAAAAGGGEVLDRRRKGSSDDVLVTLLAHPANAADRAVNGHALQASRRLAVETSGRRTERRDLVFDARLRTLFWWHRAARLRLYGSASMNVTVLTLTPAVARARPSRWFLRAGTRAMERVVEALAADVEPLRWQPPPSVHTPPHPSDSPEGPDPDGE
ncbi:MAG: hypothetical protein AAGG08_01185 [Actinomycetota bacterium]